MTGAFRPVDPAVIRRAAAEADRTAFRAALDAALRSLAAAALSAALSLGAWQAWRWATVSAIFAVREIRFTGLLHASDGELLRRSGLAPGENLFKADLPRAARAIESHPWVASARIERRLPGALVVEVREHRPAALVQLGSMYVLDDEGKLFKRAAPEDGLDLPIITGLSRELWQTRRSELQLRLLAALHLLDTWRGAGFSVSALSEVRLDDDGAFTLFAHDASAGSAGGDGSRVQEIRLGADSLSLKLRRLAQVRAALARRGERATRIDLDNPARPDQAAATLADKR
jgi:cell division protein FtsQ